MSRPRTFTEALTLAGSSQIGSYSGGRTKRVVFESRGDAVAARLFRTDIITWHPDGRIVLDNGGWNTPTTYDGMAVALGISRSAIGTRRYVPHYLSTAFDGPDHRTLTIHPGGDKS